MKKKLVIGAMALALIMALVGGATYAIFTDSGNTDTRSLKAGTVDIDVQRNAGDPVPGPMFYTTVDEGMGESWQTADNYSAPKYATGFWAPGDSHKREMTAINKGSLPAKLARVGAEITGNPEFLADAAAMQEFSTFMNVKIEAENGSAMAVMYDGPLSNLLAAGGVEAAFKPVMGGLLTPTQTPATQHLVWTCTLSKDAGNPLQGKKPVVSFYITAEQAKNNP